MWSNLCCAPLHEECPKHYGQKRDFGITPVICGTVGKRAQVFLVWVRALSVENASHPQKLEGMRVRPSPMSTSKIPQCEPPWALALYEGIGA